MNKFSDSLENYLLLHNDANVVVVIELNEEPIPAATSRKEKIDLIKERFSKQMEDVAELVENSGGNVIDTAWINQTAKVEIPTQSLSRLANIKSVELIDLPHGLQAE